MGARVGGMRSRGRTRICLILIRNRKSRELQEYILRWRMEYVCSAQVALASLDNVRMAHVRKAHLAPSRGEAALLCAGLASAAVNQHTNGTNEYRPLRWNL